MRNALDDGQTVATFKMLLDRWASSG